MIPLISLLYYWSENPFIKSYNKGLLRMLRDIVYFIFPGSLIAASSRLLILHAIASLGFPLD